MIRILSRNTVFSTPWFEIIAKTIRGKPPEEPHFCLSTLDYVAILAVNEREEIVFVSQYRPTVEREVIEFPAGAVEKGEEPAAAAMRELEEETGYSAGKMELLGALPTDTGRMTNHSWCYFASDLRRKKNWVPEPDLSVLHCPMAEFPRWIEDGKPGNILHMALIGMALFQGRLKTPRADGL